MTDLAKSVIKTFPENHGMQLACFRAPVAFCCSQCNSTKRAKLAAVVAGDWNRLLCEGCYREALAKAVAE
jgi:hypothetical protein